MQVRIAIILSGKPHKHCFISCMCKLHKLPIDAKSIEMGERQRNWRKWGKETDKCSKEQNLLSSQTDDKIDVAGWQENIQLKVGKKH